MERHKLSKSAYIRGIQCRKSLYLNKKRPFLRDKLPAEQRAKFERGHAIGALAHQIFPNGVNLAPKTPFQYPQAVVKTATAVQNATPVIYEACFQFDKVLVALDLLRFENEKYFAYEVKSSIGISDTYINDAALQYWVITNSGIVLEDFFLVTINPEYRLSSPFIATDYFVQTSVLERILPIQDSISARITDYKELLEEPHSPRKKIGPQCNSPYPCDFQGLCWKKVPKPSIFDLQTLSDIEKFRFYHQGIETAEQLLAQTKEENTLQQELKLQVANKFYIHPEEAKKTDNNPTLLFFDQYKPAYPLFSGMKPYESVTTMVATRQNGVDTIHICNDVNDARIIFQELFSKGDRYISYKSIPVNISTENQVFSISDAINALTLYIPGLGNKITDDQIQQTLIPSKPRKDQYHNYFLAQRAWQEYLTLQRENKKPEDIIYGLENYCKLRLNALEKFLEITRKN